MCRGDVKKHPDFDAKNGVWAEISSSGGTFDTKLDNLPEGIAKKV